MYDDGYPAVSKELELPREPSADPASISQQTISTEEAPHPTEVRY